MEILWCLTVLLFMVHATEAAYKQIGTSGVYVVNSTAVGYHSLVIVTNDGVVVIEPVSTVHSKSMVLDIKKITNKTVTHVFLSHNHWDHASGGQVWKDEGAKLMSHKDAHDYIKDNKGPDQAVPDEYWSGSRKDYKFGSITLECHHYGKSHGFGMTVFLLKELKIAYLADLGIPKTVFFIYMPDYDIAGLMITLEKITKLDFDTAVFTHQSSLEPGTMTDSVEQYNYMKELIKAVDDELEAGKSPFVIASSLNIEKYKNWTNYQFMFPLNVWRIVMDRHMGPYQWSPPAKAAASFTICHPMIMMLVIGVTTMIGL